MVVSRSLTQIDRTDVNMLIVTSQRQPNTPELRVKKDINPSRRYVLIRRAIPEPARRRPSEGRRRGRERRGEGGERDTLAWIQEPVELHRS